MKDKITLEIVAFVAVVVMGFFVFMLAGSSPTATHVKNGMIYNKFIGGTIISKNSDSITVKGVIQGVFPAKTLTIKFMVTPESQIKKTMITVPITPTNKMIIKEIDSSLTELSENMPVRMITSKENLLYANKVTLDSLSFDVIKQPTTSKSE
jgi:hypothetical protein